MWELMCIRKPLCVMVMWLYECQIPPFFKNKSFHTPSPQSRPFQSANFGGLCPGMCTPLLSTKTPHINIH